MRRPFAWRHPFRGGRLPYLVEEEPLLLPMPELPEPELPLLLGELLPDEPAPMLELPEEPELPDEPELPEDPDAPVALSLLPDEEALSLDFLALSFFDLSLESIAEGEELDDEGEADEPAPLLEGDADEPDEDGELEPLPMVEDDWATATPARLISDTTSAIETFFMTTSD